MEAESDVYKSFVKITESKSHVSSLHAFFLTLFCAAVIVTTIFVVNYLEFRVELVNFDNNSLFLIIVSIALFAAALLARWRRNQEYKRLREGALEIHEGFRTRKFVINRQGEKS